jgi:hypothetical protein
MVNGTMQFDQRIMSNCKVNLLTLPNLLDDLGADEVHSEIRGQTPDYGDHSCSWMIKIANQ